MISYLTSSFRWSLHPLPVLVSLLQALPLSQHSNEPKRSHCVSLVNSENPTFHFHFVIFNSFFPAPRKNTRGDFPDLAASKKDCAALAARGLPLGLQRREREPGSAVHVRAHQPRTTQRTVARQTAVCAARLLSRRDRSLSTSLHSHKPRDFKNSLLADFPAS